MFTRVWRLAGTLLAASLLWGGSWILVLKTGQRVESDGPPLIINDEYVFRGTDGAEYRLPAADVDARKTAEVNRPADEVLVPPDQPPPAVAAATPETVRADVLRLRGWLKARRFRELTQALEARQAAFESDFLLEAAVDDSFLAFAGRESGWEPLFEEWIKRAPDSYVPYAARACYLYQRGWRARGGEARNAGSAPPSELSELLFEKAARDLEAALAINPRFVAAYRQLIAMAMLSRQGAADSRGYLRRALEVCPACLEVRVQYMESLEPHWGGSYEKMREFAEEAQRQVRLNPRLRVLRGFADYDRGREARLAGRYAEAAELHAKALTYGEYWMFHHARAVALHHLGRYQDALQHVSRAIALRSYAGEPYIQRSITYATLKDFPAARRDLAIARELRCPESWLASWEKWMAAYAPPEKPSQP